MKKVLLLCFFFILALPAYILALEPASEEPLPIDIYLKKVDAKFDRGANNFVMGWAEIIRQPKVSLQHKEKKNRAGKMVQGLGAGFIMGTADVAGGFLNALTAFFPQFEIPLPQGGIRPAQITGGDAEKRIVKIKSQELT